MQEDDELMAINVPTNLLRGFVAIIDSGSMLGAADSVFVSQSALSLQIKRLEELVQQPLFVREGRRLVLTDRGQVLLSYARRLLALHDEAVAAVAAPDLAGPVRIGMVQDFAETLLAGLLAQFAELHPDVHLFARIAGTAEMLDLLDRGQLDIVLGYGDVGAPTTFGAAPMVWHGDATTAERDVIPLVVLEKPCRFREAAIAALDASGRRWRLAVETPNLSTLRAAVTAGLGITCRTPIFLREANSITSGLPPLPSIACRVESGGDLSGPGAHLADLLKTVVAKTISQAVIAGLA